MTTSEDRHPPGLPLRLRDLAFAGRALVGGGLRRLVRGRSTPVAPAGADAILAGGNREGPPDLDELWRDFNRKLSGLFGGRGGSGGPRNGGPSDNGGPNFQPDMKSAGIGVSLIGGVVALIWLGSGFFIVQEGQQAVVTSFGRYSHTADAGFQWRMPYPFQAHETVNFTQLRSKTIGGNNVVAATGLRDSSMLTQDENIVDIRFTVQYRLKDARAYLFENRDADDAVTLAAESAVREIVGKSRIDSVLYEQRDAISADLAKSVQNQLDRLKAGIVIVNVNVQSVQPPEQVQNAFEDTLKAGQDGDRAKKEGLAYASDVIPKAQGTAARLREEAEGYKAKTIAEADGDARRFSSVLAEYEKAPGVTRDRMYIDAMRQVYANTSKVLIDSRNSSNLLYLPLEKLLQQSTVTTVAPPATTVPGIPDTSTSGSPGDSRSRDNQRGRDRESR